MLIRSYWTQKLPIFLLKAPQSFYFSTFSSPYKLVVVQHDSKPDILYNISGEYLFKSQEENFNEKISLLAQMISFNEEETEYLETIFAPLGSYQHDQFVKIAEYLYAKTDHLARNDPYLFVQHSGTITQLAIDHLIVFPNFWQEAIAQTLANIDLYVKGKQFDSLEQTLDNITEYLNRYLPGESEKDQNMVNLARKKMLRVVFLEEDIRAMISDKSLSSAAIKLRGALVSSSKILGNLSKAEKHKLFTKSILHFCRIVVKYQKVHFFPIKSISDLLEVSLQFTLNSLNELKFNHLMNIWSVSERFLLFDHDPSLNKLLDPLRKRATKIILENPGYFTHPSYANLQTGFKILRIWGFSQNLLKDDLVRAYIKPLFLKYASSPRTSFSELSSTVFLLAAAAVYNEEIWKGVSAAFVVQAEKEVKMETDIMSIKQAHLGIVNALIHLKDKEVTEKLKRANLFLSLHCLNLQKGNAIQSVKPEIMEEVTSPPDFSCVSQKSSKELEETLKKHECKMTKFENLPFECRRSPSFQEEMICSIICEHFPQKIKEEFGQKASIEFSHQFKLCMYVIDLLGVLKLNETQKDIETEAPSVKIAFEVSGMDYSRTPSLESQYDNDIFLVGKERMRKELLESQGFVYIPISTYGNEMFNLLSFSKQENQEKLVDYLWKLTLKELKKLEGIF